MHRTERAARETQEEVGTLQATLENERKNLRRRDGRDFQGAGRHDDLVDCGEHGISVTRGQRLFTWIDCSRLLVDVPVIDTLAVLVDQGSRAEVLLEGEEQARPAVVGDEPWLVLAARQGGACEHHRWRKSAAQVIVELRDPGSVAGCPIGRRAFVRFPDLTLMKFLRAYLPM
jgi:hypothetical protein